MNIDIKDTEILEFCEKVKSVIPVGAMAHVATFGCQQNEADSERIRALLTMMGYKITDLPEEADAIIVNTCAIRALAEKKALSLLGRFKALKSEKPSLIIGVAGCMAAEEHISDQIKKNFHYVSFAFEPAALFKLPELMYKAQNGERDFIYDIKSIDVVEGITPVRRSLHKAYVSIMYGCNNFCTYCIVPYVRGRERSRDPESILLECEDLVKNGCREITLLGQNVNSYKSSIDFATLLSRVAEIEGDFIIRFMTSHPKDVSDDLIEVMAKYKGKIAPHFHLPLQSGSNKILKAMNRTYTREKFLSIVNKLREKIPDVAITSDVIVGFPGETEEDFLDTINILEEVRFDSVYSFVYSPREGTRAAKLDGRIEKEVTSERMGRLLKLQDNISYEKNLEYVGRCERVLVESPSKKEGIYSARSESGKLVHFKTDENAIGKFKYVNITRASDTYLFGEEKDG